jgi:hypothetical protein
LKLKLQILFFIFSVQTQAGLLDDARALFDKFLGQSEEAISLPNIPSTKNNAKSFDGISVQKNEVKFKVEDEKQYNYSFIKELYFTIHKKDASKEFIMQWMNVLSQNGSREGVYRSLVLDSSYLALESYEYNLSDAGAEFTLEYLTHYLAKTFTKKKLLKSNFYTIKRTVTEISLEIIDALLRLYGDEVYDWYAVFSADIATRFPNIWSNNMRKNKSATGHKLWAKNVPDQYIKSEVIIKLHKVINHLQN